MAYSIGQIVQLASELEGDGDVIYTYRPSYMELGARVVIRGTSSEKVCIDVQYSSAAAAKEVLLSELEGYFTNYERIIKEPANYGLTIEE